MKIFKALVLVMVIFCFFTHSSGAVEKEKKSVNKMYIAAKACIDLGRDDEALFRFNEIITFMYSENAEVNKVILTAVYTNMMAIYFDRYEYEKALQSCNSALYYAKGSKSEADLVMTREKINRMINGDLKDDVEI